MISDKRVIHPFAERNRAFISSMDYSSEAGRTHWRRVV
jgi:hypothetical protein